MSELHVRINSPMTLEQSHVIDDLAKIGFKVKKVERLVAGGDYNYKLIGTYEGSPEDLINKLREASMDRQNKDYIIDIDI